MAPAHPHGRQSVQKVYFNPDLSIPKVLMEAIQCLVLSHCENRYCFVMHMRGLIVAGFTFQQVKRLVELQELPEFIEDRYKWEITLRRLAILSRESNLARKLFATLRELHSNRVVDEIGGIVAFALQHQLLLDLYSEQIRIEEEPILFKTVDCGAELVQHSIRVGDRDVPLYSVCCVCKDVRMQSGWVAIETAIADIGPEPTFSHGFCDRCLEQQRMAL